MEKCYKLIFLLEYIKISYHILAYPLGLVSLFPHYLSRSVTIFLYPIMICSCSRVLMVSMGYKAVSTTTPAAPPAMHRLQLDQYS